MTNNMWNLAIDDGILGNLTPPDEIIALQCKRLGKITDGKIIAKVAPFRGQKNTPYQDYDEYQPPDNIFEYEFYITSTFTPNYKYSVMFINHTIEYYPLTLDIDSDIAGEIGISEVSYDSGLPRTIVEDEEKFTSTLSQIINTKKMKKVINSLYSMIKSHERKNHISFGEDDLPF